MESPLPSRTLVTQSVDPLEASASPWGLGTQTPRPHLGASQSDLVFSQRFDGHAPGHEKNWCRQREIDGSERHRRKLPPSTGARMVFRDWKLVTLHVCPSFSQLYWCKQSTEWKISKADSLPWVLDQGRKTGGLRSTHELNVRAYGTQSRFRRNLGGGGEWDWIIALLKNSRRSSWMARQTNVLKIFQTWNC